MGERYEDSVRRCGTRKRGVDADGDSDSDDTTETRHPSQATDHLKKNRLIPSLQIKPAAPRTVLEKSISDSLDLAIGSEKDGVHLFWAERGAKDTLDMVRCEAIAGMIKGFVYLFPQLIHTPCTY